MISDVYFRIIMSVITSYHDKRNDLWIKGRRFCVRSGVYFRIIMSVIISYYDKRNDLTS